MHQAYSARSGCPAPKQLTCYVALVTFVTFICASKPWVTPHLNRQPLQAWKTLGMQPCFHPMHLPLQAQKAVPEGQAGSSNQGSETRPLPLGIRPGVKPGMYPTLQSPVPQGVNPSQPGPSSAAPLGTAPSPDPDMSLVSTVTSPTSEHTIRRQ